MTTFTTILEEGLLISLFSITIVFLLLGLISFVIWALKYIHKNPMIIPLIQNKPRPNIELSDIKDEDMMVAALTASIDYFEATKENVRIVSIKHL